MLKLFLTILLGFTPLILLSQKTLDGDFQNKSLQVVINQLQEKYQIVFSYTEDLPIDQLISVSFQKKQLDEALNIIFDQTNIKHEIINETYVSLSAKEMQDLLVCGKVQALDGSALSFANVLSRKTKRGTTTDENGLFNWKDKITLSDTLEISYVGYQTLTMTAAQLSNCPSIQLKMQSFSFSEVIIKEYITKGMEQSEDLDHIILRPNALSVVPGLTEADVLQMVQILPGVHSLDESATGLHIRGGTPDQNLILWDDIPVYNSGHFFGMISAFNPYIVEDVKVFRAGFDAAYGGRVAGVIDIHSTQKIPAQTNANIGVNLTHADASVAIPMFNKKSVLVLSGRRAYTDIIESLTYKKLSQRVFQKGKINDAQNPQDEEEEVDYDLNFSFHDLNLKWLWNIDAQNEFTFSFFNIFDKLDFFSQDIDDGFETRDQINLDNLGWSTKWRRHWNDRLSSNAIVSYTNLKNDYQFSVGEQDSTGVDLLTTQANNITDLTFKLDNAWNISDRFQLDFGYQLSQLDVDRKWAFDQDDIAEAIDKNAIHATHATLSTKLKNKLKLNAGLRWNYASSLQQHYFEPRVGIHFLPNKKWQFKAAAGLYYQFMNQVIELNDLGLSQHLWVLNDDKEETPISKSTHYTTSILFHIKDFQVETEAYYKQLSGLTSFSPIFINNFQDDENYSEGTGKAWGIDILLKKRWKNYQTWLSYSYSRVFYTFDIFNENQPFPAPHDRPHALTSMHQFKYNNWNFSLSWKFASGKVYTVAETLFEEDDEVYPLYNYQQTNDRRLASFHRLDLSVLYQLFSKNNRLNGKLGLSFLNLYNTENVLSREYLAIYEEEEERHILQTLDRPMLRFTPNIVLRMEWK